MKLVIDIPEDVYECCLPYKDDIVISNNCNYLPEMTYSIANGTPLPKNHGRLIDGDNLIKAIEEKKKRLNNADTIYGLCRAVALIFDAQTIIEAESEKTE